MLSVDRTNSIRQLLIKNNSVSVAELSKMFGVSGETIRRDINKIVNEDPMVLRVHGGACRIAPDSDLPYSFRESSKIEEKKRIAAACLEEISNGDYVFLDGSTTTLYLSKLIATSNISLNVITNSLGIVNELCSNENIKIIGLGGKYTDKSHSFVGNTTLSQLVDLFAEKSFVSCSGIDMRFGITHNNEEEAAIRRSMLLNSKKRYLLIDSNKFGRCKMHRIITADNVDIIFTETSPSAEWIDFFEKNKIELKVCK